MIENIQISPPKYRRAGCKKCKKKIQPLEVRGVFQGSLYQGYLCKNCTKEELSKMPQHIKQMKKMYEKLEKMDEKEKINYLLKLKIIEKL